MKLCVIDRDKRSAAEHLSINDACFEAVRDKKYEEIVRIYRFSKPGMILSKRQDIWDVRTPESINVLRRKTPGGAVYVDENTLGYSLFLRDGSSSPSKIPTRAQYKRVTDCVCDVLRSFNLEPIMEDHWGIKIGGGVIAGHAQRFESMTFEVHGLLALKAFDMSVIENLLRLRKIAAHNGSQYFIIDNKVYDSKFSEVNIAPETMKVIRDELQELSSGACLLSNGVNPDELAGRIASALSGFEETHVLPEEIYSRAKSFYASYSAPKYVEAGRQKGLGHCFVDLRLK